MLRHQESELALIERLRSGDPHDVTDLARAYGPRIYQLVWTGFRVNPFFLEHRFFIGP